MMFKQLILLVEQTSKNVALELLGAGGLVAIVTAIVSYFTTKGKNDSEVKIAEITTDGENTVKQIKAQLEIVAKLENEIESLETQLESEATRRREAEARMAKFEIKIIKLQAVLKSTKTMLSILLNTLKTQQKESGENKELLATFDAIQKHISGDEHHNDPHT